MEAGETPEYRTPMQPVEKVIAHVDYKLQKLHADCERFGLSEEVEATLRVDLEQERDQLSNLPPDSPLHEAVSTHFERANARDAIMLGIDPE